MVTVFMEDLHGGFLNWTRGPGTRGGSGRDLPAGPFSTPRFLAAQRSAVSSRREEIAILRWRVNTQGSADPCAIPVVLVKQCLPCRALLRFLPALSLWSAIAHRFAARTTIRLPSSKPDSLSPPQGIFALQKSLRGDCGGDGVPSAVGRGTARAKKFPEEICFAPSRVCQACRTPDDGALKST